MINMGEWAGRELQDLRSVKVGIPLCAELLRLSGNKDVKDWIDEGSPACIT